MHDNVAAVFSTLLTQNAPGAADLLGKTPTVAWELMATTLAAFFLLVAPGLALLAWLWPDRQRSLATQVGLAAGISIALYPLVALWFAVVRAPMGPPLVWAIGSLGVAGWVLALWRKRAGLRFDAVTWIWLTLVALLIAVRLLPIRNLPGPLWGDSVHHTVIAQLMVDHGGLFQSWAPYAPLESFSYHFGFHTVVAAWMWLTGIDAPAAMLAAGQMLNVLAVLALYPLATRLTGGARSAGLVAVIAAGMLMTMPGYYINWGRYTQLAGQVLLPALIVLFDLWWTERTRPGRRTLILVALLAGGLVLTHYRVALIVAGAAAAWALWGLWVLRTQHAAWLRRTLWIGSASAAALILVLPWLDHVRSSELSTTFVALGQRGMDSPGLWVELRLWLTIGTYYPAWLWLGCTVLLLLALWRRPRLGVPFALWAVFTFFAANPFLVFLPGASWVTNFLIIIGMYIPFSVLLGWGGGEVWRMQQPWPRARWLAPATLALAVLFGARQQLLIIDRFHQMTTPADIAAFTWIRAQTPATAKFLVNGFPVYGTLVAGTDAGWWLPFYTQRLATVPPILYGSEQLADGWSTQAIRQLEIDVRTSGGDAALLNLALCQADVTHIFLGDRKGLVGHGAMPLVDPAWLSQNRAFTLLHQVEEAQVWVFDRTECATP